MENIVTIKGKVKFSITLDPGVWIFDDRKIDLDTYFDQPKEEVNEEEAYTKAISKHWDREILEGAKLPQQTEKAEIKYEKEKLLTGSFGIPFKPFLLNAEPLDDAKNLVIESTDKEYSFSISEAKDIILGFSRAGKPLSADGPVHVYFGDGSNKINPIKNIKGFRLE